MIEDECTNSKFPSSSNDLQHQNIRAKRLIADQGGGYGIVVEPICSYLFEDMD